MTGIAVAMTIPLIVEIFVYGTNGWEEFAFSAFLTGALGSTLAFANYSPTRIELKVREAFVMTTLSWVLTSLFAAFPLFWSDLKISFLDAWFESVSALTTTGVTILPNLEKATHAVILWRCILQWLGGTGIILMALIIFPTLRIGGMQLFRSEFSDRSDKILPRASQISSAISLIYVIFTISCGLLLYGAGMSEFDAICHAMATVSTGGLTTPTASLSYQHSFIIEMITIFYMILGGITFVLYIRVWQGHWSAIFKDSQVQWFFSIIILSTLILWGWSSLHTHHSESQNFRESLFMAISMATSTGHANTDYTQWGAFPLILLLLLGTIGACTGSTSGGLKIFRLQILGQVALNHLRQLRRPHGVYVPLYHNQKIPDAIITSVFTFVTLYFISFFFFAALLSFFNLTVLDSISAALSAMSNTGPGITSSLGPMTSLSPLERGAKIVLMVAMIMGRLELLTVFVLFMPSFWRR